MNPKNTLTVLNRLANATTEGKRIHYAKSLRALDRQEMVEPILNERRTILAVIAARSS